MLDLNAAEIGNESIEHNMALPTSANTSRLPGRLLDADEVPPVVEENAGSRSPFFFTCDHYGRLVPRALGDLGVPASEIAFMQEHKTSAAKQRLLAAFDAGRVRILIGSSPTMGTGVNVQRRLAALA